MFNLFKKKEKREEPKHGYIMHLKDNVKCHEIEIYRGVTIIYISQLPNVYPSIDPVYKYHFFHDNQLQFDKGENIDDIRSKAYKAIDELLK